MGIFTQRIVRADRPSDVPAWVAGVRARVVTGLGAAVLALSSCAAPTADTALNTDGDAAVPPSSAPAASSTSPSVAPSRPASDAPSEPTSPPASRVAGDAPASATTSARPEPTADEAQSGDAQPGSSSGQDRQDGERAGALAAVAPEDRGQQVERLQRRLARFGFAPGPVDGVYGPQTEAAVRAFQMLARLERHGRADAATIAALEDYEPEVTVLQAGDTGRAVNKLQRRLAKGPFDPGPVDGAYGTRTVEAVWALEKLAGVPVDGDWGPLDERAWTRLERGRIGRPSEKHGRRWVEFDLSQQVMKVYDPGATAPVLVSHASSGSGIPWQNDEHSGNSITPTGDFVISRRIDGWRESSLDIGRLYNPLYFNGGIAFHGALSVPLYPASHGCVRLPMHIAEYLPDELPNGTPVHVVK